MDEHLEKKLFEAFPSFFRFHDSRNPHKTLMVFGFACDNGWYDLIYNLCKDIKKITDKDPRLTDFIVLQVKEKFGGLRFYTGPATDEIFKLIHEAEKKSYEICERCGKKGKLHQRLGWLKTLCPDCAKILEYTKIKYYKTQMRFYNV